MGNKKCSSLQERLEDLPGELNVSWAQMADIIGMPQSNFSNVKNGYHRTTLYTLEKIGYGLGLIPIIIFSQSGRIEDLGNPNFVNGDPIENYVGQVLRKNRLKVGMTIEEVASRLYEGDKIYPSKIERGIIMPQLERIQKYLTFYKLGWKYLCMPRLNI